MITKYASFSNPFHLAEGIKAGLNKKEFSNFFGSALFESNSDNLLLEKAYSVYELGLLYENRKEWFTNELPIYNLESDGYQILFKGGNVFIITNESFSLLNEGFWDDANSAWETVKSSASSVVSQVSNSASSTWDALSDGAKKAYEFGKRITSAAVEFVKQDPLSSAAIFLQLLSGIVAFIPAAGQATGPIMLAIAGSLEIYAGAETMKNAWGKFSDMDVSKSSKAVASFSEGAPLVVAGIVSIMLGLNDVITAPKAAVPAAGATSTALHSAANKWSSSFVGGLTHNAEHFIVDVAGGAAGKIGPVLSGPISTFMAKGGSGLASTAITALFLKVGKEVLGTFFEVVLSAMGSLTSAFSFVLSLPTKASNAIESLIKAADSPLAQILIAPLKYIIKPVIEFLGKMIDNYIKPFVDGATKYFSTVKEQSKTLTAVANKIKTTPQESLLKKQVGTTKPKTIEVSKEDVSNIKKLPKANESLRIKRLDNFKIVHENETHIRV